MPFHVSLLHVGLRNIYVYEQEDMPLHVRKRVVSRVTAEAKEVAQGGQLGISQLMKTNTPSQP